MELGRKRILLTGANGMLGQEFSDWLQRFRDTKPIASDCVAKQGVIGLDITNRQAVRGCLSEYKPDLVINCAAYTNVDKAETDYRNAFLVNAYGPRSLALGCKEVGAKLVHISTDYVYGGAAARTEPFCEDEEPQPLGVYGLSKNLGDELIRAILPEQSLIVRTSWLHGSRGPNFVHTMLRIGREKEEIKVVNDQVGSPTWTNWLVETIVALVERDASGVFNASSRGNITWFDFSCEIFRQAGIAVKVLPQTTAECSRPAPRPPYSTLSLQKLETLLGKPAVDWRDSLRGHLIEIGEAKEIR